MPTLLALVCHIFTWLAAQLFSAIWMRENVSPMSLQHDVCCHPGIAEPEEKRDY